jgi:hypothetical protein
MEAVPLRRLPSLPPLSVPIFMVTMLCAQSRKEEAAEVMRRNACADRQTAARRRGERRVRKVDDQRFSALAIGGLSGSGPRVVLGFERIGGCKRFGDELADCVAVRRQPRADPPVSRWRRTLCLHLPIPRAGRGYHDADPFRGPRGS